MREIRVATAGSTERRVEADVYGPWAVHGQLYDGLPGVARRGEWVVTHVESGRKLNLACKRKTDAAALARILRDEEFNPHYPARQEDHDRGAVLQQRWKEERELTATPMLPSGSYYE